MGNLITYAYIKNKTKYEKKKNYKIKKKKGEKKENKAINNDKSLNAF